MTALRDNGGRSALVFHHDPRDGGAVRRCPSASSTIDAGVRSRARPVLPTPRTSGCGLQKLRLLWRPLLLPAPYRKPAIPAWPYFAIGSLPERCAPSMTLAARRAPLPATTTPSTAPLRPTLHGTRQRPSCRDRYNRKPLAWTTLGSIFPPRLWRGRHSGGMRECLIASPSDCVVGKRPERPCGNTWGSSANRYRSDESGPAPGRSTCRRCGTHMRMVQGFGAAWAGSRTPVEEGWRCQEGGVATDARPFVCPSAMPRAAIPMAMANGAPSPPVAAFVGSGARCKLRYSSMAPKMMPNASAARYNSGRRRGADRRARTEVGS